jgi:hypothetical protein
MTTFIGQTITSSSRVLVGTVDRTYRTLDNRVEERVRWSDGSTTWQYAAPLDIDHGMA